MKLKLAILFITFIIMSSCKETKKEELNKDKTTQDTINKQTNLIDEDIECLDKDTLQYQDAKISVFNEFKIRGKGVLNLTINNKVTILNEDNTTFGEIIFNEESGYAINLPSKIITRSFVPPFDEFSFDAEEPEEGNQYLSIYINKEIKKILKNEVEFTFDKWENYVKNSFINIRNCGRSKDYNTYKVIEIKEDLVKIKSISKKSCDAIENYSDVTREIKWKNNQDVLLINFYSCN